MKKQLQFLSRKLLNNSKNINIVGALTWKKTVKKRFIESNYNDLIVYPEDYPELSYDPLEKIGFFEDFILETNYYLKDDPAGRVLIETAKFWILALKMVQARGTAELYEYSRKIYGHPDQKIPETNKSVLETAISLFFLADKMPENFKAISSNTMVKELDFRLSYFFGKDKPIIFANDSMDSDAAAGNGMIVIRKDAKLTDRDIDVFEIHEGQVHIGVELNGKRQIYAEWLKTVSPRTEGTQEGLASLMEFISGATYSKRIKKLASRVIGIAKIERGADFKEIFNWYKSLGFDEDSAFNSTERLFKGSLTSGGLPFTRDISYLKEMFNLFFFIKELIQNNNKDKIPLLFNGYIKISDVPVLYYLEQINLLSPPKYFPDFNIEKILDNDFILNKVIQSDLKNK